MRTRFRELCLYGLLRLANRYAKQVPPLVFSKEKIKSILLVSCTAIGDTLMSTPAFRSMRKAYPHANIDLLIHPSCLKLFQHNPHINRFIPYQGRWKGFIRLAWQLRKRRYDMVVILHGNEPQVTPLAYLSGAHWIFKISNDARFQFLLTNRLSSKEVSFKHIIAQRLAIAQLAGGADTDWGMELAIHASATAWVAQYLQQVQYRGEMVIGLHLRASTPNRCWPPGHYVALAKALLCTYPHIRIVITGSVKDQAVGAKVAQEINNSRVLLSAGKVALHVLPALVAKFTVLVTPDTGIMHMAIAIRTPIIGLFAATNWHHCGPRQDLDKHIVIQKNQTCMPCQQRKCGYRQPICMDQITVAEVQDAVTRVIESRSLLANSASLPLN